MIMAFLKKTGNTGLYVTSDVGRMTVFLWQALRGLFKRPHRHRELLRQVHFIGVGSLPVIVCVAASTGMVLGLQGYYSLNKFGAEGALGSMVSLTLIMELGPVLTALMVGGRAGSAMCAEIGIMRISEQIDALECMAINPFRYLISPKFFATLISVPLLTAIFDVVGIAGGYVAGVQLMGVSSGSYIQGMVSSISNHEIQLGIIKSIIFGLIVVWICTGRGFFVKEIRGAGYGAESVSKVTTQAVVLTSIAVLVFDYLITAVLL